MRVTEYFQDKPCFEAQSPADWNLWLEESAESSKGIWLILHKQSHPQDTLTYAESVEEALCYGWVDGRKNSRDQHSYYLYFAPRNPQSFWSKSNRIRIEKLEAAGKMRDAGRKLVKIAKATGTWLALESVENLEVPLDLEDALKQSGRAWENYQAFSDSGKRLLLDWILRAKKAETRAKRIHEIVAGAAENVNVRA